MTSYQKSLTISCKYIYQEKILSIPNSVVARPNNIIEVNHFITVLKLSSGLTYSGMGVVLM